jgi:hypothetical protein
LPGFSTQLALWGTGPRFETAHSLALLRLFPYFFFFSYFVVEKPFLTTKWEKKKMEIQDQWAKCSNPRSKPPK